MKSHKKVLLVMVSLLILIGVSYAAPPEWFMTTPTSPHYYYFTGSFSSDVKSKAYNSAKAEVVGSILFMINSTVSASTSFDQVYTRNSRRGDTNDSRLFKKIKTQGQAVVSRLQFVKTEFERARNGGWTSYVLARIPKQEVDASIRQFREMRERLKRLKTACVIVVQYPDGEVKEASALKSFIEKFYRETLGYNIVEADVDLNALKGLNMSAATIKMKQILNGYDQVILGIVSLQETPTKRRTQVGGIRMTTISASGTFLLRTVELASLKVVENNDYSARGVSTRNERDAMDELVNEFKKQLQGDDSGAGGRDAVFD